MSPIDHTRKFRFVVCTLNSCSACQKANQRPIRICEWEAWQRDESKRIAEGDLKEVNPRSALFMIRIPDRTGSISDNKEWALGILPNCYCGNRQFLMCHADFFISLLDSYLVWVLWSVMLRLATENIFLLAKLLKNFAHVIKIFCIRRKTDALFCKNQFFYFSIIFVKKIVQMN